MSDRTNCPYRHENGNCLPVGGFCTAVSDEHCEQVKRKNDKDKVNKVLDDIVYLDWYFDEDNGGADKEAVAAYNNLRPIIFNWIEQEKRKPRYIHLYNKDGKEIGSLKENKLNDL